MDAQNDQPQVLTIVIGRRGGYPTYSIVEYVATETPKGPKWKKGQTVEYWRCSRVECEKRLPVLAQELGLPYHRAIRHNYSVEVL